MGVPAGGRELVGALGTTARAVESTITDAGQPWLRLPRTQRDGRPPGVRRPPRSLTHGPCARSW